MAHIAEFNIIGHVGGIKEVGTTVRVSIASNYGVRNSAGEWEDRTRWNEVTIFSDASKNYVRNHIRKGDLLHVSGSLAQRQWEKDGETVYGMTLAAERINRLAKGGAHEGASAPEHRAPVADDDIPF